MKKIKTFMLAFVAMAMTAPMFTACGDDDTKVETVEKVIENLVSEYSANDKLVADQKAQSGKPSVLLGTMPSWPSTRPLRLTRLHSPKLTFIFASPATSASIVLPLVKTWMTTVTS